MALRRRDRGEDIWKCDLNRSPDGRGYEKEYRRRSQVRVAWGLIPFLDPCNLLILLQSEAGCRILINALLIHVASTLETNASGVVIAPEFRVEDMLLGTTENSFGGVVDYMLVYGDKAVRGQCVSGCPNLCPTSPMQIELSNRELSLSATLRYTNCSSATSMKRSPKIFSTP